MLLCTYDCTDLKHWERVQVARLTELEQCDAVESFVVVSEFTASACLALHCALEIERVQWTVI